MAYLLLELGVLGVVVQSVVLQTLNRRLGVRRVLTLGVLALLLTCALQASAGLEVFAVPYFPNVLVALTALR